MARPGRNASPSEILRPNRTFFATTNAFTGKHLLQSERNANLLIEVLRSLVSEKAIEMHDFVIMPDHIHLLVTVPGDSTIEKTMQLVKGRFSHRLSHELGFKGEVWQRGFSEVQVLGKQSFEQHRTYIANNPVKAGLVAEGEEFPFCYVTLARRKSAGAKAQELMGRFRHD